MSKIKSIKTIEEALREELKESMVFADVLGDTIELRTTSEEPISFSIMNGDQITPRHREVNLKINFKGFDDSNYIQTNSMIPLKRTRSIFQKRKVAEIKNMNCLIQMPGEVNYMYGISFLRNENEKEIDAEVIKTISELIQYNYQFIQLHKNILKKGKELTENWGDETKQKHEIETKQYKNNIASVTTIPMMKENDLTYIITDYKTPEGLILPQRNDMFPHKRLNSVIPKIFPSPRTYIRGDVVKTTPPMIDEELPKQEPNTTRRLYQMEFAGKNGTRIEKILDFTRETYIPDFIKIHYDTLNKTGIKK